MPEVPVRPCELVTVANVGDADAVVTVRTPAGAFLIELAARDAVQFIATFEGAVAWDAVYTIHVSKVEITGCRVV